jgi:hypothetical protein
MDAMTINDNKVVIKSTVRAWTDVARAMTQLHPESKCLERCAFEVTPIPSLV